MSVLHTASFKEFRSLMCLWQALKLWKMQLEVRSLNVTWRRDLWCHRVIVFWKCTKLLAEQLWQIWRRYAPPFFRYLRKTWGGGRMTAPPPAVRGLKVSQFIRISEDVFEKRAINFGDSAHRIRRMKVLHLFAVNLGASARCLEIVHSISTIRHSARGYLELSHLIRRRYTHFRQSAFNLSRSLIQFRC